MLGRIHSQVEDEVPPSGNKMSGRKRDAGEAKAGGGGHEVDERMNQEVTKALPTVPLTPAELKSCPDLDP